MIVISNNKHMAWFSEEISQIVLSISISISIKLQLLLWNYFKVF